MTTRTNFSYDSPSACADRYAGALGSDSWGHTDVDHPRYSMAVYPEVDSGERAELQCFEGAHGVFDHLLVSGRICRVGVVSQRAHPRGVPKGHHSVRITRGLGEDGLDRGRCEPLGNGVHGNADFRAGHKLLHADVLADRGSSSANLAVTLIVIDEYGSSDTPTDHDS